MRRRVAYRDCRAVDQNEHYLELSWIILPIQIDICSQHVSSCLYVDSTTLFASLCDAVLGRWFVLGVESSRKKATNTTAFR